MGTKGQVIKSRKIRWARNLACMRNRRGAYKILVGKSEGKNNLEDLCADGKARIKCIFKKWDRGIEFDWSVSGQEQVAGCR